MRGEFLEHTRKWENLFQDAALNPAQWLPALELLADETGSSRAELVGFGGPDFEPFNWITGGDPKMLESFLGIEDVTTPAVNYRLAAAASAKPLEIAHEHHFAVARKSLLRHDYLDFCEQYQTVFGCQATLLRQEGITVGLSVLRSRREGCTTEDQRRIFAQAAPAARTAVLMQRAVEMQGFHLLAGTLGSMRMACFLLDRAGQVRGMTPSAEDLLAFGHLKLVDRRLNGADARESRQMESALRNLLQGLASHERLALRRCAAVPGMVVDLFRLPLREWTMHFAPHVMVVVRQTGRRVAGSAQLLASAFGLTEAELQVALAVGDGRSREDIVAERGVSIETLRAQLKSIYQKTDCRRESQLVLLVKAFLD